MKRALSWSAAVLLWGTAASALAAAGPPGLAPAAAPAPSGRYEGLSPLTGAPHGLLPAGQAIPIAEWLDVTSEGSESTAVVAPERRVIHSLRYGPHGLTTKTTTIDGAPWSISTFGYDAAGKLRDKRVEGPTIGVQRWTYETDRHGRITSRRSTDGHQIVAVSYDPRKGAQRTVTVDGLVSRVERWDRHGRLAELRLGRPIAKKRQLRLSYQRRGDGSLAAVRVARILDGRVGPTAAGHVGMVPVGTLRAEVRLALGAPQRSTDSGRGVERRLSDGYSSGCWLNEPDALSYDAVGRQTATQTSCICGFCVAPEGVAHATDVLARDSHLSVGPWLRLDRLVITADHQVLTPTGPRAAGLLRVGDAVLDAAGKVRHLGRVERLAEGPRPGVNLRTRRGWFVAADIRVASEAERRCGPRRGPTAQELP